MPSQKDFQNSWRDYKKKLAAEDSPDWWDKQLRPAVPDGNLAEFIRSWVWKQHPQDRARILQLFAMEGHAEIGPFLDELEKHPDELARELACDARAALEEFLAS